MSRLADVRIQRQIFSCLESRSAAQNKKLAAEFFIRTPTFKRKWRPPDAARIFLANPIRLNKKCLRTVMFFASALFELCACVLAKCGPARLRLQISWTFGDRPIAAPAADGKRPREINFETVPRARYYGKWHVAQNCGREASSGK
jgi:hypothetical protein